MKKENKQSQQVYFYLPLLVFCFTMLCNLSNAQIITTVAGTGTGGFSGDGGPATAAEFNNGAIAFDAAGNLYVSERFNNRVRVIMPTGMVHTFAGTGIAGFGGDGGPATAAQFSAPLGVTIDPSGNIYITDRGNYRVRKINAAGIVTTVAGTGTSGFSGDGGQATNAQLLNPGSLSVDLAGNIYVHGGDCRIRKIDPSGIITTFAGTGSCAYSGDGGPATAAGIASNDLIQDMTGDIYISDMNNNRIRKVDGTGTITTVYGTGTPGFSGDGAAASAARINSPGSLAMDHNGNIYFDDIANYRIRMIDMAGNIHSIIGNGTNGFSGDGGLATAAQISSTGLAFDCAGNLYLSDGGNYRIRMVTYNHTPAFVDGISQTLALCAGAGAASLNSLLAVSEADTGQTDTWNVALPPVHGTLAATYTATSTGSTLVPAGLSYTPVTGFIGNDTFTVQVSDCKATGSTTVYVTVSDCTLGAPHFAAGAMLRVWPNPAQDVLFVEGNVSGYNIMSMVGSVMQQGSMIPGSNISVKALPAGVYMIALTGSDGQKVVRKFIKE